jgi:hypothetical protein
LSTILETFHKFSKFDKKKGEILRRARGGRGRGGEREEETGRERESNYIVCTSRN